ncbi:F/Y rich C-terminus-domain-containing protein, partial [Lentinula edodes]
MSPAQLQTEAPPAADSSVEQETTNQPSSSSSKPRRLKSHAVVSKHHSIPTIPRDKHGQPMLPLNVGIMTVVSLGTICLRDHFHSERYIFPVGYTVTRRYLSTLDPNSDVVYHCTILDGGDGPKFQIVPADDPDKPIMASTATGAWSSIVKKANEIRKRQHSNSVSGPDFFGLGQNTIRHLIQQMPGAERLAKRGTRTVNGIYVWQHYIEGGPLGGRHAAVIPALPEEY